MKTKKRKVKLIRARPNENKFNFTREFTKLGIRAATDAENERKFILSFSSEEPYERWWGVEVLDHSENAMNLTRLNEIGCLLFNHDRDKVIGKIIKAYLEDNRGVAEVEFDTDEASELIYQKVLNKTLKGVSVGYQVDSWEEVASGKKSSDDKFTGPVSIARKWTPYEISIVSIPADPTVGVGRDLSAKDKKTEVSILSTYENQITINKNLLI